MTRVLLLGSSLINQYFFLLANSSSSCQQFCKLYKRARLKFVSQIIQRRVLVPKVIQEIVVVAPISQPVNVALSLCLGQESLQSPFCTGYPGCWALLGTSYVLSWVLVLCFTLHSENLGVSLVVKYAHTYTHTHVFLFKIYLLKYSSFTMLCQFHVYSKVIQLCIHIYPFFNVFKILSTVPCALQ